MELVWRMYRRKWLHSHITAAKTLTHRAITSALPSTAHWVRFHPEDIKPFTDLLTELYDLASSSDYIRDMRINEKLGILLTLLMEQSWHAHSGIMVFRRALHFLSRVAPRGIGVNDGILFYFFTLLLHMKKPPVFLQAVQCFFIYSSVVLSPNKIRI